ncbi:MAG: hypothetical protein FWF57_00730 [Defluviitaleaceae bacterium]|nr:hypothetical protein [Defluviitaleaceae bacterium]
MKNKLFRNLISFVLVFVFAITNTSSLISVVNAQENQFIAEGTVINVDGHDIYFAERNNQRAVLQTSSDGLLATLYFDMHTGLVTISYEEEEQQNNSLIRNFGNTFNIVNDELSFYLEIDIDNNFEANDVVSYIEDAQIFGNNPRERSVIIGVSLATILGAALFATLVATVATRIFNNITHVIATSVVTTLRNNSRQDHYMAELWGGQLYIGNALTFAEARARLVGRRDVWSRDASLARAIAGGNVAVGPETGALTGWHMNMYFMHYHLPGRNGGHSFWGNGEPGRQR